MIIALFAVNRLIANDLTKTFRQRQSRRPKSLNNRDVVAFYKGMKATILFSLIAAGSVALS
ncbi:MAG: hypothetical protein M3Z64_04145, partial [Verrucomicrobiota bacterium]|nr:hypothetical protein [Verrucomicrobiota bacterium]